MYRRTYEWDDKNQLIKSQDDNVTVCYTYGSDGQRASKYTENSETLYTNDFWVFHVSGSVRNGAGIINKNIYLGKMRVVTKVKEAFDAMEITERQCQYFYHSDHLGSAQLVTDNKGNEYQRIEYTPYGETWIDLKATQNDLVKLNYKFTAKELDEETGLYYYGARYLNPKYSMWISTDPALGEYFPQAPVNDEIRRNNQNLPGMGGIFNHINSNLYHYAGNNPVKYIDPDGRASTLEINGEYHVQPDFTWYISYEKIVKSLFYFGGDQIFEFFNWLDNLKIKHIDEGDNDCKNNNLSNFLGAVSLIGDLNFSKYTNLIGKWSTRISWGLTALEIRNLFTKKEQFAIEDFTTIFFCVELVSNSHEVSSILYRYAKSKVAEMYKNGSVSFEYDFWGMVKLDDSLKINDKDVVQRLKDELIMMKKDLEDISE